MADEPPVPDLAGRLAGMSPLAHPLRRSLYLFVVAQGHDVTRGEAADALGTSRPVAAFHLDKLVAGGLLEASFRRLGARSGPGAGRSSKLYRRSSRQHELSLPPRNYELAARLLAQAVEEAGAGPVRPSLTNVGRRFGEGVGREIRSALGRRSSRARQLSTLADGLDRYGYEPYAQSGRLRLRNCPFRALAEIHRALVCGMNLALIEGVVAGMEAGDFVARQEAAPGQCCVVVDQRRPSRPGATSSRDPGEVRG